MCLVLSACSFALKILHGILGSVTAPTDSPVVFLCKISIFFLIFLKISLEFGHFAAHLPMSDCGSFSDTSSDFLFSSVFFPLSLLFSVL